MNVNEARAFLTELQASYPQVEITPEQSAVWCDTLKDVAIGEARAALKVCRREFDFLPTHRQFTLAVTGVRHVAKEAAERQRLNEIERQRGRVKELPVSKPEVSKRFTALTQDFNAEGGEFKKAMRRRKWGGAKEEMAQRERERLERIDALWGELAAEGHLEPLTQIFTCPACQDVGMVEEQVAGLVEAWRPCPACRPLPEVEHAKACSCMECRYGARRAAQIRSGTDGRPRAGPDPLRVLTDQQGEF